jgi:hypothetical protein
MLTQDAKEVEHRLAQSYALFHVVIGFLQCLQGYLFEVELPHCPDIYQKIRGEAQSCHFSARFEEILSNLCES